MRKNTAQPDGAPDDNTAPELYKVNTQGYNNTLRIRNT